jgi:hypothetical protein
MRNFLAFLAAAIIVMGGVGWYLDWFKVSSKPSGDGHQKVEFDVNTNKAGSDVSTALQKGEQIIEKDKSAAPKSDDKGADVKADPNKGVEVKSKNIDISLPPLKPIK